ncbi:MAG: anhydro-N-acetylmuramic acid kinase, partial [Halomonas sp.]|nr:anhydro-N-acetylmuramic acid kinase [Halomonas sp.]
MATDPSPGRPDLYIGAMTGTSIDGLDLCLCDFATTPPRLVAHRQQPLDASLSSALRQLARGETDAPDPPAPDTIDRLGMADRQLAEATAEGVQHLLAVSGVRAAQVRAIGSHGQTIRHRPDWGQDAFTLQIGDPSRIAELTGITVAADFRRRDMAAGGQGAPLAPPAHAALFPPGEAGRIVINLGGIANASILLPGEAPVGFDTGPANTLMDAWHAHHRGTSFDRDGRWAASGQIGERLLAALLDDPFFARPAPKSTGPEHFHLDWLRARGGVWLDALPAEDVQA